MGTNYYWSKATQPPCDACKRGYEEDPLHIGKSSAGWCFSLHVMPEKGINDLPDWREIWKQPGVIRDEYGEVIPMEAMERIITARHVKREWDKPPFSYKSWPEFHRMNNSEQGPVGLLRHRIGTFCVSHGNGTWDCITGEFS